MIQTLREMIVSLTLKVAGSLCAFSSITQGRNPKTMEMQTRDPLVHLDHQGYVAQKVWPTMKS